MVIADDEFDVPHQAFGVEELSLVIAISTSLRDSQRHLANTRPHRLGLETVGLALTFVGSPLRFSLEGLLSLDLHGKVPGRGECRCHRGWAVLDQQRHDVVSNRVLFLVGHRRLSGSELWEARGGSRGNAVCWIKTTWFHLREAATSASPTSTARSSPIGSPDAGAV